MLSKIRNFTYITYVLIFVRPPRCILNNFHYKITKKNINKKYFQLTFMWVFIIYLFYKTNKKT